MNDEQIIEQLNSYDENGDGKITVEGFYFINNSNTIFIYLIILFYKIKNTLVLATRMVARQVKIF